jgi:hypothetical protein
LNTIWIYMSTSVANAYAWPGVRGAFPLWQADYNPKRGAVPYWIVAAWQYTSTGIMPGYTQGLDISEIYSIRINGMPEFTLPTSRPITQNWNMDFNWFNGVYYPNGFYSTIGWYGHNGIDYGCFIGDPVEAVCDGVIEFVGSTDGHPFLSGGGMAILLRNDEIGKRFEYLHLSQANVYTGQRVKAWQVIGLSGNTGTSTAPHLHLGMLPVNGLNLANGYRGREDPTPYLYPTINPGGGVIGPTRKGLFVYLTEQQEKDIYWFLCAPDGRDFLATLVANKILGMRFVEASRPGVTNSLSDIIKEYRGHVIQNVTEVQKVGTAVDNLPTRVLNAEVPWFGFDGNGPTPDRNAVNLKAFLGYADAQNAPILKGLAELSDAIRSIQPGTGGAVEIDYAKLAKAVNDDAARRLAE